MSKKLIVAFMALAVVVGSAFAAPARADYHHHDYVYRDIGHHRYRGYWSNGVFINLGLADVPVAYAPPYAPPPVAYYPPPPAYYYPPAPAYYYPPAYYPPAYFMGAPVGVGVGLNFRIK